MIELGKYTQSILIAYGVSLTVLVGLIWQSVARNARARRALPKKPSPRTGGPGRGDAGDAARRAIRPADGRQAFSPTATR